MSSSKVLFLYSYTISTSSDLSTAEIELVVSVGRAWQRHLLIWKAPKALVASSSGLFAVCISCPMLFRQINNYNLSELLSQYLNQICPLLIRTPKPYLLISASRHSGATHVAPWLPAFVPCPSDSLP